MFKKAMLTALAAAALFGMAVTASAATYTSPDGIISIELPNDSWVEVQDPQVWVALSDGSNVITVDHFSNGEKLPDIRTADSQYVNTLTAAYTTQNEVFIANGLVTNPAVMNEVNQSILSIKVLQYDTKTAVQTDAPAAAEFTIVPRDMTMYVKVSQDSLNVRSSYSISSQSLGSLSNGSAVKVTGVVQHNGADYGWYQIAYNNGSGFVSADYLSSTAPAANTANTQTTTPAPAAQTEAPAAVPDTPNETYLVYSQGSGRPVNITGSNGTFYDGSGNVYYAIGGGNFQDSMGAYYSTTMPASAPDTEVIGLVSDGSGRPVTIMQNEDGTYTDEEGNNYYEQEDGSYVDDYDATYQESGSSYDEY